MRDIVILIIVLGVCIRTLQKPWIGVIAWSVISLMSTHVEFGYAARGWPVGSAVAVSTLIGLLLTKEKQSPFVGAPVWCLLVFVVWICITLPFSFFFDWCLPLWERSMKIYLMLFVTLALINDRRKLDIFIWANVVALGYYGVKGGIFTILTGGNFRVWGPGGFIEGNNEVALAVIAITPLMRYLQLSANDRRLKLALTAAMGLCVVTALGTYSRGALVGLAAMGSVFWWKSGNKLLWGALVVAIGMAGLALMPDQWWARMDTIKTYEEDSSAMGRINAWWMAFNLAKDNIFGGGFQISTAVIFQRYAPDPNAVHAAHSIYFQVLGEHGFIGLAVFLSIGVTTWWTSRSVVRLGRSNPAQQWAGDLGAMVQVSMIGYGTAGAFLSLAYFDLPYNVMIMAVLARRFANQELALAPAAAAAAGQVAAARNRKLGPAA